MPVVTNARRWTADDLDRLPDDGNRYEPGEPDFVVRDRIQWWPEGAAERLTIDLPALFREALDG